ncbi:MAG TPA: Clp protease N-terminal domain-containing protein, partial [Pedococcus sp.]|nr:Clp protease N-terminal domain-containing protein [Pedococcus sp.]
MELKPTAKVAEALAIAQRSAQSSGHPEITPAHLALALAEQPETTTPALLSAGGTSTEAVAATARSSLAALPRTTGGGVQTPGLGQHALAVLQHANTLMQAMGDAFLSTDVLLLALVEKAVVTADAKAIEAEIPRLRGGHKVTSENPEASAEALEKYGSDLTQAARDGKLDPVIGRDAEIRRVVQVLS